MSKTHRRASASDMELFSHAPVPSGTRTAKNRRQTAGFYPFLSENDILFSIVENAAEIYDMSENEIYSIKNIDQVYVIEEIDENYGIIESEQYIVEEK